MFDFSILCFYFYSISRFRCMFDYESINLISQFYVSLPLISSSLISSSGTLFLISPSLSFYHVVARSLLRLAIIHLCFYRLRCPIVFIDLGSLVIEAQSTMSNPLTWMFVVAYIICKFVTNFLSYLTCGVVVYNFN